MRARARNWRFGDGSTSSHKDPIYNYNDKGRYTVSLTVTDSNNINNQFSQTVEIYNLAPTANFSFTPLTAKIGRELQFTDQSTDPEEKTLQYAWTFGDGFTSNIKNPKHSFTSSGIKNIHLTVTDDEGLTSNLQKTINILRNVSPIASFTINEQNIVVEKDITFSDKSSDSDGHIISWEWDYGDGSKSNVKNPTHAYTESGDYVIKLTVTDDDDATHTYTIPVEVKRAGIPAFPIEAIIISVLCVIWIIKRTRFLNSNYYNPILAVVTSLKCEISVPSLASYTISSSIFQNVVGMSKLSIISRAGCSLIEEYSFWTYIRGDLSSSLKMT